MTIENNADKSPKPFNPFESDEAVSYWFELSYSSYCVLPRVLMESMPAEWQRRMVKCLQEAREAFEYLNINDNYEVRLRDPETHRYVEDPYKVYRHKHYEPRPPEPEAKQ